MADTTQKTPDASGPPEDDLVLPFEVKPLGVRGRVVRLGPVVDDILSRHDYPPAVSALLGEAVALAALLGSMLKHEGKLILQTRSDGPVDLLVADFIFGGGVRGYARFSAQRLAAAGSAATTATLLGSGHLALTMDQGADTERYQGIVPLSGTSLTQAALAYFEQSEQIPTRLRLAAGPLVARGADARDTWRAGAVMVQHLPRADGGGGGMDADDEWTRAHLLMDTVEDHEVLDPMLSPQQLLWRLYHEDGVTVYPPLALHRYCTCSQERIDTLVENFSPDERTAMTVDGKVLVTCEFCSTRYEATSP